jgi:hypothetical protein
VGLGAGVDGYAEEKNYNAVGPYNQTRGKVGTPVSSCTIITMHLTFQGTDNDRTRVRNVSRNLEETSKF